MSFGLAMRATPPSARIMAGTRSSAMTAIAPACFGNARLLDVHDVHDDAALEHLGQADLQPETVFAALCLVAVVGGSVLFHLRNPLLAGR